MMLGASISEQRDTWIHTELSNNKPGDQKPGTTSDLLGNFREMILSIFLCFPVFLVITKISQTFSRKSCGCKLLVLCITSKSNVISP